MTSAGNAEFDIAIVGLGPVGCTAALALGDAGLRVVAFERDPEVYALPRAVNFDAETLRMFQRIGRADDLVPMMQPAREGERYGFCDSDRNWLFGSDLPSFGANGWQPSLMFDQPEVEGYLRDAAISHPNVTTHIAATVESFDQDADGVTVTASTTDGASLSAHASYLLGSDGASSFVRRSLDIGWKDLGYDHEWLVVDVIAKDGHTLNYDTVQVCDPDRLATYVCTKDPFRRWEFKLKPGETRDEMLDPERIMELIDAWTPRGTYELRRSAVYLFHAATAQEWRRGRVFLLGDAAHQTPPFIGQGLNSGMRDVANLAWKLPLVIAGKAAPGLLDSYQAERDAHALDLTEWAVSVGKLMEHLAAVEAAQRSGATPPEAPPQAQRSGYGQGREAPPLRDGVLRRDQVSDTGSTGYLFSQPIVRDADGHETRLDHLLGSGFALVGRSDASLHVSPDAEAVVGRLGMSRTSIEQFVEVRGHFDRSFAHADAVIVRPDRYIFGHTSETVSLDELIHDLAEKTLLR